VIPVLFAAAIGIGSGIYIWEPSIKEVTSPKGLEELKRERQAEAKLPEATRSTTLPPAEAPSTPDSPAEPAEPKPSTPKHTAGETPSVSIWSKVWGSSTQK